MRLSFNALVLIPSDHCNIKCRHCAPECGPSLKSAWNVDLLKKCITDAAKLENLQKRLHFAGGEPFLYFPQMLELCAHARSSGFASTVVTNGFWAKKPERAKGMFRRLADAGMFSVELSTDIFHQEHIPIVIIRQAIQVLKSTGLSIVLRVVTTRRHTVSDTMRQFSTDDLDGIEVLGSPAVPMGRALLEVQDEEFYRSVDGARGCCERLLNLTVRSDGSVFPCCAGSEENPSLALGNLSDAPLDALVRRAELNLTIKRLIHSGPASFFDLLRTVGLGHKIRPSYTNICHACTELFGDDEVVAVINRFMNEKAAEVFAQAIYETQNSTVIEERL
jgi:hypothetical protein